MKTGNETVISLLKIHKKLSFTRNLMNVLCSISQEATTLLNGDRATIYVYDRKRDALISYVASKLEIDEIYLKKGEGIAGKVAESKKSLIVNNTETCKDFNPFYDSQTSYKTRNLITSPLLNREGELVGVIQVLNKKDGSFQITDLEILEILASVSAIALEQAHLSYENQILKDYNRLLIQNFNAGVLVLDPARQIQDFNNHFLNLFQIQYPVQGKKIAEVCPELEEALTSKSSHQPIEIQTRKGRYFQISPSELLDSEQKKAGTLILITDITEKVKKDQEKELEERMSILGKMSSQIIHDIKNPLFVIRGYTKLLATTEEKKDQMRYLDTMEQEVSRILEITQEILEFSRGDIEVTVANLSVAGFHRHLLEILQRIQDGFGISINCVLDPDHSEVMMKADLNKLERAIRNLLLNAIEACQNMEEISIELETCIREDRLAILIKDRGAGIPESREEIIFNPFISYNKSRGTGLGLSISRAILEKHGGSISLKKEEGWKTCFEMTLPLKKGGI